jgi:ankyrin repeat protein
MYCISFEKFECLIKRGIYANTILNVIHDNFFHELFNHCDWYYLYSIEFEKPKHINEICKITQLFIDNGADPNHKNKWGYTALELFARQELTELNEQVVKLLLNNGATYQSSFESKQEFNEFVASYKLRNIKPAKEVNQV